MRTEAGSNSRFKPGFDVRTEALLHAICDTLSRNCGDMHAAARENGISPRFLIDWAKDDPEAAQRFDEACRIGWMGLESEAIRRATRGVDKGIYHKGELVAVEKVYSDNLLVRVMEARIPEYSRKEKGAGGAVFNGPTQVNIMPRANNFQEWLEMKNATLGERQQALPAPDKPVPEVLAGEYRELSPLEGLGL